MEKTKPKKVRNLTERLRNEKGYNKLLKERGFSPFKK